MAIRPLEAHRPSLAFSSLINFDASVFAQGARTAYRHWLIRTEDVRLPSVWHVKASCGEHAMPDPTGPDREDVKPDSSIREAGPSIIGRIGWQICRTLIAVLIVLPATATASDAQGKLGMDCRHRGAKPILGRRYGEEQSEAIAVSTRKCEAMSAEQSDCGAEFVAFRTGWALALLCGGYRVIVAEKELEDTESSCPRSDSRPQAIICTGSPAVLAPSHNRSERSSHDLQNEAAPRC